MYLCYSYIKNINIFTKSWIIDSVIEHNIYISKCNPLARSSYIKLPKELNHPRRGLISIENIDDAEYFKWCIVRYLHPADHNPRRVTNADEDFTKKLDFKDIILPVIMGGIHKSEKNNSIEISVFGYENKEKHTIYVPKNSNEEKHVDLLLIREEEKKRTA